MPGGDKKWDISAERDLCLAIILGNAENEKVRHNWPRVHAFMGELGYDFTKDAISQHFTKAIMKDFKKRHGAAPSGSTPKKTALATPRSTPRKRAPAKRKAQSSESETDESEAPVDKKVKKVKDEEDVKDAEKHARNVRERSATVRPDDKGFEAWLQDDSEE